MICKKRKPYEPVIPVPYKIYKHMVSYGNTAFVSPSVPTFGGLAVGICIIMVNNIPYIVFTEDRGSTPGTRYHYAFYFLKDI